MATDNSTGKSKELTITNRKRRLSEDDMERKSRETKKFRADEEESDHIEEVYYEGMEKGY